jgi:hypothetical protein
MSDDSKTFREHWGTLTRKETCPPRLVPFVGSCVLDEHLGLEGSTRLTVELSPGLTADGVAHLGNPLASFFDLAVGAVFLAPVQTRARRIEVTFKTSPEEG